MRIKQGVSKCPWLKYKAAPLQSNWHSRWFLLLPLLHAFSTIYYLGRTNNIFCKHCVFIWILLESPGMTEGSFNYQPFSQQPGRMGSDPCQKKFHFLSSEFVRRLLQRTMFFFTLTSPPSLNSLLPPLLPSSPLPPSPLPPSYSSYPVFSLASSIKRWRFPSPEMHWPLI